MYAQGIIEYKVATSEDCGTRPGNTNGISGYRTTSCEWALSLCQYNTIYIDSTWSQEHKLHDIM